MGSYYLKNSFAVRLRLPIGAAFAAARGALAGARVVADMRVKATSIRPRFVIAA